MTTASVSHWLPPGIRTLIWKKSALMLNTVPVSFTFSKRYLSVYETNSRMSMVLYSARGSGVRVGVGVLVGTGVLDGVGVLVGVFVGVLVFVGVGDGPGVFVGRGVAVGDKVGDAVGDAVGEGTSVGRGVSVTCTSARAVAVPL